MSRAKLSAVARWLAVIGATIAAWLPAVSLAQSATVALTADRLLDVVTGRYVDRPLIVISDGRIVFVGRQGDQAPDATERVDLPGVTLLPGLIDMHVHLSTSPLYSGYRGLQFTDSFWPILATRHAKDTLEAGFTTVRALGSSRYDDVGLRQAIDAGHVPGPRIVPATYAIGSTGGHCDSSMFPPSMERTSPAVIDGADQARRMVRKLRKYGAEVIKICTTGGVFSRGDTPGAQQMTLEEVKAIVDEARMTGMKVAAHAHGASGIKLAIQGGVDTIEHASLVDDEGIRMAVKTGTYFGMDIYNTDYTQASGKANGVLDESLKKDRDIGDIQRENFRKSVRAGVKQIFSTDAGIYPHGDNAKQFAVMVRYGATPLQAIQSATVNAGNALGRANDVGRVVAGLFGDLVGVRGDALADISLLERPIFVMKGGQTVRKMP